MSPKKLPACMRAAQDDDPRPSPIILHATARRARLRDRNRSSRPPQLPLLRPLVHLPPSRTTSPPPPPSPSFLFRLNASLTPPHPLQSLEHVLQNINRLNRNLEGVIAVGDEFGAVEALWSRFEGVMGREGEEVEMGQGSEREEEGKNGGEGAEDGDGVGNGEGGG